MVLTKKNRKIVGLKNNKSTINYWAMFRRREESINKEMFKKESIFIDITRPLKLMEGKILEKKRRERRKLNILPYNKI